MSVLRLHARHDLRLHDEPRPTPADGEVLVRVTAVGLCGSDLHWYEEGAIGDAQLERPLVLGHEIAGVIDGGPRAGTRVAIDPADPCEVCPTCRAGSSELCPTVRFAGHSTTDGGLRGWMAWPERLAYTLPGSVRDRDISLIEPLAIALHAVDLAALKPGMRCAVIGSGPIGLLVIKALMAAGIEEVMASDLLAHRVDAAREAGARPAWQGSGPPEGPAPDVDVAFDCAGEDDAVETAIEVVRPGGRVVLVGIPADDRTTFTASVARRKGLTLVLSRRSTPHDMQRAIELVAEGTVEVSSLITERFALTDAPAAFAALAERRGLKIVVEPRPR